MQIEQCPGGTTEGERFASMLRSEVCAMRYEVEAQVPEVSASLRALGAGALTVVHQEGRGEQRCTRDPPLIRADGTDLYVVCSPLSGQLSVAQDQLTSELTPGQFSVLATRRPFGARIGSKLSSAPFAAVHLAVPGPIMRRHVPQVDDLCGNGFLIRPGSGHLLLSLIKSAVQDGSYFDARERERLGHMLLGVLEDVTSAATAHRTPASARIPALAQTFERAMSLIESHLSDPDLSPAMIARMCGVSKRYIHAAFAAHSASSVSQLIRDARLQACEQALQNSKLRHQSVTQIACDWGFDDVSYFGRLYKMRYGRTPREGRGSEPVDGRHRLLERVARPDDELVYALKPSLPSSDVGTFE